MQGSFSTTSAIITPQSMIEQVKDTLDKQFDEAYARKDKKTMQTASKLKGMMRK
jgi:flagellar motor switch protein FliM